MYLQAPAPSRKEDISEPKPWFTKRVPLLDLFVAVCIQQSGAYCLAGRTYDGVYDFGNYMSPLKLRTFHWLLEFISIWGIIYRIWARRPKIRTKVSKFHSLVMSIAWLWTSSCQYRQKEQDESLEETITIVFNNAQAKIPGSVMKLHCWAEDSWAIALYMHT